jgi:hypothetical protein
MHDPAFLAVLHPSSSNAVGLALAVGLAPAAGK